MKLNIGCGLNHLNGFINVDIDPEVKPDQVVDLTKSLPWDNNSIDQVVMYHTIEHLEKDYWPYLFMELSRILKVGGQLIITFPEYPVCMKYWEENYRGQKLFWEATIFGRGTSVYDRHVSITSKLEVKQFLMECGFSITLEDSEPFEDHNSVIKASNLGLLTTEIALGVEFDKNRIKNES